MLDIFETSFNRYQVIKSIGQGGSGVVVYVTNEDGEDFALKYLAPENLSKEKLKRFKNELSFCKKQEHKNIIKVLDDGYCTFGNKKCPFYVMPYYTTNLRQVINKQIPAEHILPIFSQILDGVEAAHLQNIWHRDLKPENILCNTSLDTLVVADFGIAHFEEPIIETTIQTTSQARLANFQYAAPEQRERGASIDHRADIYALGLILNEMFTKKLALGVDFEQIGGNYPQYGYLDDIVNFMLNRSVDKRPVSIDDIKQMLITRKNDFVSRQKLNLLQQKVIQKTEIDDPLVINPPIIINSSWDGISLIIKLNQVVNSDWVQCYQYPKSSHESIWGKEPYKFKIDKDTIHVASDGDDAQQLLNYAKDYIALANTAYKNLVQTKIDEEGRQSEKELRKKMALLKKTQEVNKNLKF